MHVLYFSLFYREKLKLAVSSFLLSCLCKFNQNIFAFWFQDEKHGGSKMKLDH